MRSHVETCVLSALIVLLAAGTAAGEPTTGRVDFQTAIRAAVAREAASGALARARADAAEETGWARVQHLDRGARVRVVDRSGDETTGRIEQITADAVSIAAGGRSRTFDRARIAAITVPSVIKRLVYGSLGVAGGVIAGFLLCPSCSNEGNPGRVHGMMATLGAVGSVFFLFPQESTIYRASAARP